jgi:hypothetical protein
VGQALQALLLVTPVQTLQPLAKLPQVAVVAQPTLAAVELRSILPRAVLVVAVQVLSSEGLQLVLLARLVRVTLVVRVITPQSMPMSKKVAAEVAQVLQA